MILVTGAGGQLGHDICGILGDKAAGVTKRELDITKKSVVEAYVKKLKPSAIIHCAAYTAVDKAESDAKRCYEVNVSGTAYLAKPAAEIGAKFLYISTDYVFDGILDRPYETDDMPDPVNVYGRTKLEGENVVRQYTDKFFIVRTSWLFGNNGNNFVKTMLRIGFEQKAVNVISDQYGSPTYTHDLAKLLAQMINTEKYGVYHAANNGFCSRYDFARVIFEAAGMSVKLTPVVTSCYPASAARPKNSALSTKSLKNAGFPPLPDWETAVREFIYQFSAVTKTHGT